MDKKSQDQSSITVNDLMVNQLPLLLSSQNDFNDSLNQSFKNIGEVLDLDRISLFYYDQEKHLFFLYLEYCNLGIEPRSIKTYPVDQSASMIYLQGFKDKNDLSLENVSDFNLNDSWLSYLKKDKIKAFFGVPLFNKDELWGYLSFENQRRPQSFKDYEGTGFKSFIKSLELRIAYEYLNQEASYYKDKASQTVENKYVFFANVSHEVRTPLNGIHNALYLLQTTDLTKEQKTYLDMANESVDGISSTVDRILDLEALETGKLEIQMRSFNLEDEMIRLIRMYQRQIEQKKINLHWDFDYKIQNEVIGDERKLRNILAHVLHNAVKFTDMGDITLKIKHLGDERYLFEITDTGVGISEEHIGNLYDAFFQIDMKNHKEYQGLGIGLTVAHELTKLLDGKLSIESKLGVGTKVSLELELKTGKQVLYQDIHHVSVMLYLGNKPSRIKYLLETLDVTLFDDQNIDNTKVDIIIFEDSLKTNETISQMKELYGNQNVKTFTLGHLDQKKMNKADGIIDYPVSRSTIVQKINSSYQEMRKSATSEYTRQLSGISLVVDDNRLNRIALESILKKLGLQAKLAESGAKAIEMVKAEHFDLILMDIQMPHMDGIEATRRIRSFGGSYATIPIVAVTANSYFNDYDMLKASQINDVIFKPIKMESLGQILRKFLLSVDTIRIPDEILTFDEVDFLKRFEGSYDIAKEVISTFQVEYHKDLNHIKEAVLLKNSDEIIKTAHYYKGSCAYLSGKRLVWLVNRMMDQAKQNQLDEMNDLVELLFKETEELIKELKLMIF